MRKINRHVRSLRRNMTEAEKRLWHHLRDRRLNGHKFRRQWTIGPYVADFASIDLKCVIELDCGQHSESESDSKRTAWLESEGWLVLRFWNTEILENTNGVLEILSARFPPAAPPSSSAD